MTAFTSKAAGNWSSAGQTTWNQVGVPGDGDTVTYTHTITVDTNTTVGTDAAATDAITGNTGGNLIIASGVTLTCKGRLTANAGNLTLHDDTVLSFYAATNVYNLQVVAGSILTSGTSAAHPATIIGNTGGANNAYFNATASPGNGMTASYLNVIGMGGASRSNLFRGSSVLDHATFTSCGYVYFSAIGATQNLQWSDVSFVTGAATTSAYLTFAAATTGARTLTNIVCDKTFLIEGNLTNLAIDTFYSNGPKLEIGDRAAGGGTNATISNLLMCGKPSTSMLEINRPLVVDGFILQMARSGTAHGYEIRPYVSGTVELKNGIYGSEAGNENADFGVNYAVTTPLATTLNCHNVIGLPSYNGATPGPLFTSAESPKNVTCDLTHITWVPGAIVCVEGTVATEIGRSGWIGLLKSINFWCNSGKEQYAVRAVSSFRQASHAEEIDRGTLSATDATSFSDSTRTWTANMFSDVGTAYVLFTSGNQIGVSTAITGNSTTTTATVAGWVGSAPNIGDTYIIYMLDQVTPANADYNNQYRGKTDGTIYRQDGTTTTSVHGYTGQYMSAGTPGAHDLAVDPQFVDATRNFATADIACFGNAAATAWNVGHGTYNVGDIVSNSNASWYGGVVINYRCILSHTAAAGNEPGVSATWDTQWEYATSYRCRTDLTKLATLRTWITNGFAPQNVLLKGAGHDGGDIGAVPVVLLAGSPVIGSGVVRPCVLDSRVVRAAS